MNIHRAMNQERPRRGFRNGYSNNSVWLSGRLFNIVELFHRLLFKLKSCLMNPPLSEIFSMLLPILECLCGPGWLNSEVVMDERDEMPFNIYDQLGNTAVNGGIEDQEFAEDTILCIAGEENMVENRNEVSYKAYFDELGLDIVEIERDGNCMFRALADQLSSDQELHKPCRQMVVNYMITHPQDFKDFYEGGDAAFPEYCQNMANDGVWGDNLELQAASLVFKTNIHLYVLKDGRIELTKIDNFHGSNASTVRLAYQNGSHYNSLCFKTRENEVAHNVTERKGEINDTDSPSLLSLLLPYPDEKDDDTKAQTVGMANSATIKDAFKLLDRDLGGLQVLSYAGTQRTGEDLERERLRDHEEINEKLRQHINSENDMFTPIMPDSPNMLSETGVEESKEFNLVNDMFKKFISDSLNPRGASACYEMRG